MSKKWYDRFINNLYNAVIEDMRVSVIDVKKQTKENKTMENNETKTEQSEQQQPLDTEEEAWTKAEQFAVAKLKQRASVFYMKKSTTNNQVQVLFYDDLLGQQMQAFPFKPPHKPGDMFISESSREIFFYNENKGYTTSIKHMKNLQGTAFLNRQPTPLNINIYDLLSQNNISLDK